MELRSVVDDRGDEEEPHQRQERPQAQRNANSGLFFGFDLDDVFAYPTKRMVRVKDASLGVLYMSIVALVVLYIGVVAFYIEGKHSLQDTGIGTVIVNFKGKTVSDGKVYDHADLRFPAIEPSAAFILTKRVTMVKQTVSYCLDMDNPPRTCPCNDVEQCNADGYCATAGWCPSLGDRNAANPPEGAVVERITGLENTILSIFSGISFPSIGNYFYRTGLSKGASNPFKNITLGALFKMIDPPVAVDDILDTGAVILVSFQWHCDVLDECEPTAYVSRQDLDQGFVQKRVRHRRVEGERVRDAYYAYGIRIIVDSFGLGRKISIVAIIMQIGSGLALLRTASFVADTLMLSNLYEPARRKAYYSCKVKETQDYSDLQDRINLIQDHREEASRPPGIQIGRSTNGLGADTGGGIALSSRGLSQQGRAGTNVVFGLGPGGRAGMATSILRGRGASATTPRPP